MNQQPRIFALVVAAGSGKRAGGTVPKQYAKIGGKPLLRHSLQALKTHPDIAGVQVVIDPLHTEYYAGAACGLDLLPPAHGGAARQDSVRAGLKALAANRPDYVLIHDAARPFLSQAILSRIIGALAPDSAVMPALAVADTVRRLHHERWEEVPRDGLLRIQTPQGFPFAKLLGLMAGDIAQATDDAALWLAAGYPLRYVEGEERLRKVTNAADMQWAEERARGAARIAVGSGFDVHRFADGGAVILGGIAIPHDKKLEGHSDADVVLHALVDAILGALAEGDIGRHFPPGDPRWKGADSKQFTAEACRRVYARGGRIEHADVTVICEAPKIDPHREAMRQAVASMLGVPLSRVSIKATTTEGLGFTGRGEGIAAQAMVTLALPETA
jgi:2-C-methyl-D-erythritol 4-phosphate cytidylyltransferase/2-C-methyl-D-erythritol 2,4-cyclodiphosphate synthase